MADPSDMSGDEVLVFLVSGGIALFFWFLWVKDLVLMDTVVAQGRRRAVLLAAPLLACGALLVLLTRWASADVRDSFLYTVMYLVLGMAWLGLGRLLFRLLGVDGREDVLERRNDAALPVLFGAIMGLMACYAGANIGDGPGWWCVVFSAGISTALWCCAWLVLDQLTGISDAVSIGRDAGAGVRLGAFLLTAGVILGRAAAGDWHSASMTIYEFRAGWPLLPLFAGAFACERMLTPRPGEPDRSALASQLLPAAGFFAWTLLALLIVGWPEMGVRGPGP